MAPTNENPWEKFESELVAFESALTKFCLTESATSKRTNRRYWDSDHFGLPHDAITQAQVEWITSADALAAPHGVEVLEKPTTFTLSLPELPNIQPAAPAGALSTASPKHQDGGLIDKLLALLSARSNQSVTANTRPRNSVAALIARHAKLTATLAEARKLNAEQHAQYTTLCGEFRAGESKAVTNVMLRSLQQHPLPGILNTKSEVVFDKVARVALCTIEIPDLTRVEFVKSGAKFQWRAVSTAERKRLAQLLNRSLCIRAAYLIAMCDPDSLYETVAINARQKWFDPATGEPREGVVASLMATKAELRRLQPGQLDPEACFRHLLGIATPNILNAAPVRPIFVLNTADNRVVANRDVAAQLPEEANLAAMAWEDFEHLVRQLFELMFANQGVEVKVTRASRDRGVDAIVFDPDPIRGGKYVIQAKRYTRTVDVAAVRDLYGTVMNEGANRGILVTTSSYGPDSYDFAKDKPISLIDGPNLLVLLRKHGRNYRIDIEEARRIDSQN